MASWESKSWPLRRWLADRLIGRRGYSKNVAPAPAEWVDRLSPHFIGSFNTTLEKPSPFPFLLYMARLEQRRKPFDQETA